MAKERKQKDSKRTFKSGAYRDTDVEKLQFRRCLSHRVLFSFAEFMRKHNTMPDGTKRNEENWKKGFPQESFMDSKFRHLMTTWKIYEEMLNIKDLIESLNAELFNTMGWLDLLLRPEMTIDKFRKTIEGIEKLNKSKKAVNIKASSPKIKLENHFKETLKRIEERKKKRREKPIHYWPPNRLHSTLCGLVNKNNTIKATGTIENVTCKTCLRIIKNWNK